MEKKEMDKFTKNTIIIFIIIGIILSISAMSIAFDTGGFAPLFFLIGVIVVLLPTILLSLGITLCLKTLYDKIYEKNKLKGNKIYIYIKLNLILILLTILLSVCCFFLGRIAIVLFI